MSADTYHALSIILHLLLVFGGCSVMIVALVMASNKGKDEDL